MSIYNKTTSVLSVTLSLPIGRAGRRDVATAVLHISLLYYIYTYMYMFYIYVYIYMYIYLFI